MGVRACRDGGWLRWLGWGDQLPGRPADRLYYPGVRPIASAV